MAKSSKIKIPNNGAQTLAISLIAAKKAEAEAKSIRCAIEDKLLAHPSLKNHLAPEGTVNFEIKDGDSIKIVGKLYRRVDQDKITNDDWNDLPIAGRDCFRWKAQLQLAAFKALDKTDPKTANKVRKFFTTTPGRAAITVTVK